MNRACPPCNFNCQQKRTCPAVLAIKAARAVPYITTPAGVRIGSAWQPPAPRPDTDAEQLQGALLWERQPQEPEMHPAERLLMWVGLPALLLFVTGLAAGWIA